MSTEALRKAVERIDAACVSGRVMPSEDAWQTIRQALRDQEAEIAELKLVVEGLSRYGHAEKADALLREIHDAGYYRSRIDTHLKDADHD